MARARKNPIGMRPGDAQIVQIGPFGKMTHILHPDGYIICKSGKGRGPAPQQTYTTKAKFVTCYRCQKLAHMNQEQGRASWDKGS